MDLALNNLQWLINQPTNHQGSIKNGNDCILDGDNVKKVA